ncbi:Mobile element protein [Bacillus sp. GeD10]|nr:Mobile element protein [Bacillus sp. GeD10]
MGLLHRETDLKIYEHYTDTAGYTDQVFGLTHLLGFRFAPRISDLADTKLFSIPGGEEYANAQALSYLMLILFLISFLLNEALPSMYYL